VTGLRVDGNGQNNPYHRGRDRNEDEDPEDQPLGEELRGMGIWIAADHCCAIGCVSNNMPNGTKANNFEVSRDWAIVAGCTAKNPGRSCFQNTATALHSTYCNIRGIVEFNYPDNDKECRLFNITTLQPDPTGRVSILNSFFRADIQDVSLAPEFRSSGLGFSVSGGAPPTDPDYGLANLVLKDVRIELGEHMSATSKHIFKVNNVRNSWFEDVVITTHDDFVGHAMRVNNQEKPTQVVGNEPMKITLVRCDWDQGINFTVPVKRLSIASSKLGKRTSRTDELLANINLLEEGHLSSVAMRHRSCMASVGVDPRVPNPKLSVRNGSYFFCDLHNDGTSEHVEFEKNCVFRVADPKEVGDPVGLVRLRPISGDFLNIRDRLALTSDEGDDNSYLFDPENRNGFSVNRTSENGVSNDPLEPYWGHEVLGPPFTGLPGHAGTKIYLEEGTDPDAYGWQNAAYWVYDEVAGAWAPAPQQP